MVVFLYLSDENDVGKGFGFILRLHLCFQSPRSIGEVEAEHDVTLPQHMT